MIIAEMTQAPFLPMGQPGNQGYEAHHNFNETFEVTVPVSVSGTFYAWVFQYTGKMRILGPEPVKEGYIEFLKKALDDVLRNE